MSRRNLFFAIAPVLIAAAAAAAQDQNNTIRGKIRSTTGATINNAIVELRMGGSGMIGQTVTRNDGDFSFSGLVAAEYELAVTLAGYEPTVEMVHFHHSPRDNFQEVLSVEITLRPKAELFLAGPGISFVQDVPRPARAAYEKGIARLGEGKSPEGIALLREATSLFGEYFNAYLALGKEYYRTGKLDEALEALERARQINDREGAVYLTFGLVMVKQQKFGVAEYAFREAARLNSGDPASHFYHGVALIEIAIGETGKESVTDLADAEKELNRAMELSDKKLVQVHLQLARIHERQGDKQAAVRDLENYLKSENDSKKAAAIRQAIARLRGAEK